MPSHLTRLVFRSIIADTPLLYRGCVQRSSRLRTAFQHDPPPGTPQRRTFMAMFKSPRKIKPAQVPAGLDVLGSLIRAQRHGERPPTPAQVAGAVNAFFLQPKVDLEDFHAGGLLNAIRYLLDHPDQPAQPWLPYATMKRAMVVLDKFKPKVGGRPHLALARLVDAEIKKIIHQEEQPHHLHTMSLYHAVQLPKLVRILTIYGASSEARELASAHYASLPPSSTERETEIQRSVWYTVAQGFAKEENTPELMRTAEIIRSIPLMFTSHIQGLMLSYFAQRNDLDQAKYWYMQNTAEPGNTKGLASALAPLLKACAQGGDTAFGQQVVTSMLQEMPNKETWDAVFIWSAAIGKGPDEIDRMMNVMVRRSVEEQQRRPDAPLVQPDIDTINLLVDFAMSKQDSYSAERYVVLGEKRGIFPNARTYTMQITYRLSINDVDGARAAYYGLQGQISDDSECIDAVNRLIQALCQLQQHHFDDIMAIVDDLHECNARLAPETVATLCVLHLQRGEPYDAGDLLNVHAHHMSIDQRVVIRKGLASFIMDSHTSTADAWDAYQMLRNAFQETPRCDRIPLMNEFFARKRPDMACHVFFHMRNSVLEEIAADREVYIAAFTGFARNADAESLELAHNQLKIDLNIEMDTKLRNALMLAYASTGQHPKAMQFWAEIGSSQEGPTYNSIAIAFRACEGTHYGERHAKSIWHRLQEMDVDIDKQIFTAYLSAIARNHRHEEALALVESAEETYGFTPDFYM